MDCEGVFAKVEDYIAMCERSKEIQAALVSGFHRDPESQALDQLIRPMPICVGVPGYLGYY